MELKDLLVDCTVRVETRAGAATGFFIAPGLALTPAHVVESPNGGEYPLRSEISVHYKGLDYPARTIRYAASPSPDVAVIQTDVPPHPSAYLYAPARSEDPLFVCGYPMAVDEADRLTFENANFTGPIVELGPGGIPQGMAGAPVLNFRTGGVCAIVRNDPSPRQSATSVSVIDTLFPEIRDTHDQHHQEQSRWFDASDVTGTVFAARNHIMAMRQACQEPIQTLLSPKTGVGAVDLMAPVHFKVQGEDGLRRRLMDMPGLARHCGSDGQGIMIVGPPGSGRSSMLRYLGYAAALGPGNLGVRGRSCLFPILIRANQMASRKGEIEERILDAIGKSHGPLGETYLPPGFLSDLVETPGLRLLIMIDGVDEIQNSRDLAEIVDSIGRIRNETKFGEKTRMVVTSKPSTAEHFRYSGFEVYEIQALDDASIALAVRRWLRASADRFLQGNRALVQSGLLSSPLALSVALALYEREAAPLPSRLVDLYAELVKVSAGDWHRKRLGDKYGADIIDNAVNVLGFLALELLRSATVQDREWLLQSVTRYFIQHLKIDPASASERARRFAEFAAADSFFLRMAGDRFYWTHQSFQDYFAALRLTTSDDEAGNAVKAIRSRWFDANRGNAPAFAAAMLPDEDQRVEIAREILASGREERRDFLRNLSIDGAELPDDLMQDLIDDLRAVAWEEREEYGTILRRSARASFAFDLLLSLRQLPLAAEALEAIASDNDWPSQMCEEAKTVLETVSRSA